MTDAAPFSAGRLARLAGPFAHRPRLLAAILIGVLTGAGLVVLAPGLSWNTDAILAWDAGCASFVALATSMMAGCDQRQISARAATQDEGQHFILALTVIAAAASIVSIAGELSLAKHDHGAVKALRVVLAFATLAASWTFVQFVFALHYAHGYYFDSDAEGAEPPRGGLLFPGGEDPDYWDFLHFAMIIGVACQTADIAFTSKTMRRTGTAQGVFAFAFNTVVLALTINLLAGLF